MELLVLSLVSPNQDLITVVAFPEWNFKPANQE